MNKRSIQAKNHFGLALFCYKKPPKLQDNENVLTHYQRAFKKTILMTRCSESNSSNIFLSRDDKAYICPGTSTGMRSARNQRIVQQSNPAKQQCLPKYDWPQSMVNATPGVNRIFMYQLSMIGGEQKLKMTDDDVVVFNRPKFFVGSNGSVWASEYFRMRYEEPLLFTVRKAGDNLAFINSTLNKARIRLMDAVKYFALSCCKEDIEMIKRNNSCLQYEKCRLQSLLLALTNYKDCINENQDSQVMALVNTILEKTSDVNILLSTLPAKPVLSQIFVIRQQCIMLHTLLVNCIPELKSRIHEFTDAGPGVGITNNDVKLRIAETILITDPMYYLRFHLAHDDSSYNEVERIQSYVGDAICDGGAIEWEYKTEFEGLNSDQLQAITLENIEKHELNRMKYNAFEVCNELTTRIDGAVMPDGFMKAYTSYEKEDLFFNNHQYIKDFISSSLTTRKNTPGAHYFTDVTNFLENHIDIGQKYLEYTKSPCGSLCHYCLKGNFNKDDLSLKIVKPFPDYEADGYHYLPVAKTPLQINGNQREIDDYQPRKQIAFYQLESNEEIETFSKKFIVEKPLLVKYLDHLKRLTFKKDKRKEQRLKAAQTEKQKSYAEYKWEDLVKSGKIMYLKHYVLNKYLEHHSLSTAKQFKRKEKSFFIKEHCLSSTSQLMTTSIENMDIGDYSSDDSNSEESGTDEVINTNVQQSDEDSDKEDSEEECGEDDEGENMEHLFTVTRSGRIAGSHYISRYV